MRALVHKVRRDERGASAIFIALCFTVLFGFVAIAVDLGDVVQERRELQNGADSAALAVAKDCTTKSTCGAATATADTFADQNARDGQSNIDEVCGNGPGLAGCSGPPTLPAGASGYVRVRTSTNDPDSDNPNQIQHHFAPVLSNAFVGKTVHASATAAWGAPGGAAVLPLAMSVCEFNEATANGTTFATPTGGNPPYSGPQRVIQFHGDKGTPTCPAGPAGKPVPGGWGYLVTDAGCSVDVDAGGWTQGETGNDTPDSPCEPSMFLNKTVLVPIFDELGPKSGSNQTFHIKGFAAFYVTGMRLGGTGSSWTVNPPSSCSSSQRCIGGWFVKFVATGDTFGGPNLGAVIVKMIG